MSVSYTVYVRACVRASVDACVRACVRVCACVKRARVCARVTNHSQVRTRARAHTHTHTHARTHARTRARARAHTHTHTHTSSTRWRRGDPGRPGLFWPVSCGNPQASKGASRLHGEGGRASPQKRAAASPPSSHLSVLLLSSPRSASPRFLPVLACCSWPQHSSPVTVTKQCGFAGLQSTGSMSLPSFPNTTTRC